jgi:hypothetical protein
VRDFDTTADGSGALNIAFTTVVDNALVNGVEVMALP